MVQCASFVKDLVAFLAQLPEGLLLLVSGYPSGWGLPVHTVRAGVVVGT